MVFQFGKIGQFGCPKKEEIAKIAEIKAARDILVHNKGFVNFLYVKKNRSPSQV